MAKRRTCVFSDPEDEVEYERLGFVQTGTATSATAKARSYDAAEVSAGSRATSTSDSSSKRQRLSTLDSHLPQATSSSSGTRLADDRPRRGDDTRSVHFWYPDGNIVLRVESTLFKLHLSRLGQYCEYFPKEYELLLQVLHAHQEKIEGCPVYSPFGLTLKDFDTFLMYFECPTIRFAAHPMPEDVAASILRAARVLKCPTLAFIAQDALDARWPSHAPPSPKEPRRAHADALALVVLAREHRLPRGLLKRAFAELLPSRTFWDTLARDRAQVPLEEADVLRLHDARRELEHAWGKLVLAPPPAECCAPEEAAAAAAADGGMGCKIRGRGRAGEWCVYWLERGDVECGAQDPWRYVDVLKGACDGLRARWCWWCLEERMRAWDEALKQWWTQLDEWLRLK